MENTKEIPDLKELIRKFRKPPNELLISTLNEIKSAIKSLTPGERIQYHPSSKLILGDNLHGEDEVNWDICEEIQMDVRGPYIPDDIFVTLRLNDKELIVDMYRLPQK